MPPAGRARLVPRLPASAWWLIGAGAVSSAGSGLVFPFLVIYLHEIRGLGLSAVGIVMAAYAAGDLVGAPIAGSLADRRGARRVLVGGLGIAALGAVAMANAVTAPGAFGAALVSGVGVAATRPSVAALLATAVATAQRSDAFAVNYAARNAGFGVGAVLGGLLVDVSVPGSFVDVLMIDALSFVAAAVIVTIAARGRPSPHAQPAVATPASSVDGARDGGYREVLRDRVFRRLLVVLVVLGVFAGAQFDTTFPAVARIAGVSTRFVGFAFAANTFTIVAFQLVVLRGLRGRRRSHAIALAALLWGSALGMMLVTLHVPPAVAAVLFLASLSVFAAGEMFLSPSVPALVNDLAPDHLRARYNATSGFGLALAEISGPVVAGFVLDAGYVTAMVAVLATACVLTSVAALRLERVLPAHVNRVDEDVPTERLVPDALEVSGG